MKHLNVERVYDEFGRAQTIVSVDDLVLSLDGHTVDLGDKRLKALWHHLAINLTQHYTVTE